METKEYGEATKNAELQDYWKYDADRGDEWDDEFETAEDHWDEDGPPEWAAERNRDVIDRDPPRVPAPTIIDPPRWANKRPDAVEKHWVPARDGYFGQFAHDMYEAVTPNDRALDLCLRHIAGQNLICWPSRERIAQASGLTISEIRTSETHLIGGDWLAMEAWRAMSGDRAPYCYILYPLCRRYTVADLDVRKPYGGWHVPREVANVA